MGALKEEDWEEVEEEEDGLEVRVREDGLEVEVGEDCGYGPFEDHNERCWADNITCEIFGD